MAELNGVGLAAMAAGSVFVYGGITGKSPVAALYAIVRGQSPASAEQTRPLTTVHNVNPDNPRQTTDFSAGVGGEDSTPSGGGSGNGRAIAARLSTHIHNRNAVAGVLGNMNWESGLDPTRPNPREGAIGLCQWEGTRRTRLRAFAASRGTTETDLMTQVDFVWHELTGTESEALLPLMGATSPEAAAATFDAMYERSDGSAREDRKELARKWYNTLYGGQ